MLSSHELPRERDARVVAYPGAVDGERRGRRVDWNAVAAVMATFTATAALVTAIAVLSYVRSIPRQPAPQPAGLAASLESLWRLRDEWNSDDMGALRSNAAAALLDHQPNGDVDDVLFFFDEIGFLWQRGALDDELIWYEFYWPMANYWKASEDHIRELRNDDPSRLAALDGLMQRLVTIEARQRKKAAADAVPTAAQVRDFLNSEVADDPCMEDDDEEAVRRMPT